MNPTRALLTRREPPGADERVVGIGGLSGIAPVAKPFELNCANYQVSRASIGHGRSGAVFRCTLGPVTDEVLKALEAAARTEDVIRLVFPLQPLLLERIEVTRIKPRRVRISGRIVDTD
jgi:hypothetical protein